MFQINSNTVRKLMIQHGMTIRDLARKAGTTEKTAAAVLRGSKANMKTIGRIANALGVDGETLLKGAD